MKAIFKLKTVLTFAFVALVFSSGCNTYPDGGSIGKADERLTDKVWKLSEYLRNGNDETDKLLISNFQEEFEAGGSVNRSYTTPDGDPFTETGSWEFDTDKQQISLTGLSSIELTEETSTVTTSDYNILRLKKDELWYSFENGGDRHEFHLVSE